MSDSKAYSFFLAEKTTLLRQLPPYAFIDAAVLNTILDRTWKKLSDQDKDYYVKKTSEPSDNAKLVANLAKEKMERNEPPVSGELDPYRIYHDEMRLIVLQDLSFVRNFFSQMNQMIARGWVELNDEQRLVFFEKVVADAENKKETDSTTTNSYVVVTALDSGSITQEIACWKSHSWDYLTNESDSLAFCAYAKTMHAASKILFNPTTLWKQWLRLSDEEQDEYYKKVPEIYALMKAEKAFMKEKTINKSYNHQRELLEAWKVVGDEVKQYYAGNAYQDRLKYEEDPQNRFIGEYNCLSNVTTIDDMNSQLTRIPHFTHAYDNDGQKGAFVIFMEMERPELLKDPEVAKKRYYVVNNMLHHKWMFELKDKDKQKYCDMVKRFIAINSTLYEWFITAEDVYNQEMRNKLGRAYYAVTVEEWKTIDAGKKKKLAKAAIENRKVLLKKYPDLYEYYAWTRCDDFKVDEDESAQSTPKNTADKEVDEATQHYIKTSPPCVSGNTYTHLHEDSIYGDVVDNAAFKLYKDSVGKICSEKIDESVLWRQFIRLSDEDRDGFYDEAQKNEVSSEACQLFLKDNDSTSEKVPFEHYQKWESLSAAAKQYYVDVVEKDLLQRKKAYPEDYDFVSPKFPNLTTKDIIDEKYAVIRSKYPIEFTATQASNFKKACMVYIRKEFPELLNEPGMVDKRYFQLKLILRRRFIKLSDEERKPYVDLVQRIREIKLFTMNNYVSCWDLPHKFQGNSYYSYYEGGITELMKPYRLKLLEEFPDVDEHFQWTICTNHALIIHDKYQTSENDLPKSFDKKLEEVDEATQHYIKTVPSCGSENMYILLHESSIYGDTVDNAAFKLYKDSVRKMDSEKMDESALWRKFIRLSDKDRDGFYDEAQKNEVLSEASQLFFRDNNATNEDVPVELHQKWENLSDAAKQHYIDIVEKDLLQREKAYPEDYDFKSPESPVLTTKDIIDERDAVFQTKYSIDFIGTVVSNLEKACMVYIRKKFPELLKEPGMTDKRYFQLKLILRRRFMNLSDLEREPYLDEVKRVREIIYLYTKLNPVSRWEIPHNFLGNSYHRCDILSYESKENREKLLKEYPDVDEHFRWTIHIGDENAETTNQKPYETQKLETQWMMMMMHDENEKGGWDSPEETSAEPLTPMSIDEELEAAIKQLEKTTFAEETERGMNYDDFFYGDTVDNEAFMHYRDCVSSMSSEPLNRNILWRQFIRLSDEERAVYYAEALKTEALKEARKLFAIGNSSITWNPENQKEYDLQRIPLYKKWEKLSADSKQYYLDTAEKHLLERRKEYPSDVKSAPSTVSYLKTEDAINKPDAYIKNRYSDVFGSDGREACMVYMMKQFPELLKEPGMTDKRYFQLKLILGFRWKKLSGEERNTYCAMFYRILDICDYLQEKPVQKDSIVLEKFGGTQQWEQLTSDEDKAICLEELKQNKTRLLEEFPDVDEHFRWIVCHKQPKTDKGAQISETEKLMTTDETTKTKSKGFLEASVEPSPPKSPTSADLELEAAIQQLQMSESTNALHHLLYGNFVDREAFQQYQENAESMGSGSVDRSVLWWQFVRLSESDRMVYNSKAQQKKASLEARKLFAKKQCSKKRVPENEKEYAELMYRLYKDWENLSAAARQDYIDIVIKLLVERYKNGAKDIDGVPVEWKYLKIEDAVNEPDAKIHNINAEMFECDDRKAQIVYMRKEFPSLSREPGMAFKAYFELKMILAVRFTNLSDEEQKPYYDMVQQIKDIEDYIQDYPVDKESVMPTIFVDGQQWDDLSDIDKEICVDEAKQNRLRLLEAFPDVDEFFRWIIVFKEDETPETEESETNDTSEPLAPKSTMSFDEELEEAIQYLETTSVVSKNGPCIRSDAHVHGDTVDDKAFEQYERNIDSMHDGFLNRNVLWRQFIRLSDEERAVIYDEALKYETSKLAKKLFAEDNSTIDAGLRNLKELTEQQQLIYEKWEKLSADSKQHYLDTAEKTLLQRRKECPEDCMFVSPREYYLNSEDAINEPDAYGRNKYSNVFMTDPRSACMVYMKKKFPELLKEPGMADKRYFQLKLILGLRFSKLSGEERKPYFDVVWRCWAIENHTREYSIEKYTMPYTLFKKRIEWDDLSDEDRAKCLDELKKNKSKFLKEFPDIDEHYQWRVWKDDKCAKTTETKEPVTSDMTSIVDEPNLETVETESEGSSDSWDIVDPENNSQEDLSAESLAPDTSKSAADKEVEATIQQYVTSELPKSYWAGAADSYCDFIDEEAFELFKDNVESMGTKGLHDDVLWRKFILFSDEERAVYYNEAIKKQASLDAPKLFAEEKSSLKMTSETDKKYAQLIYRLYKEWESLGVDAKQHYVDIAEKKLQERKKDCLEDAECLSPKMSYLKTKVAINEPKANIPYYYFESTDEEARWVYVKQEFPNLLKEPGMADKRYFQLQMILHRRFMNLSDEERKPFLNMVQRSKNIRKHIDNFPIHRESVMYKRYEHVQWKEVSDITKTLCTEEAKQNKLKLLEEFPDLDEHVRWELHHDLVEDDDDAKTSKTGKPNDNVEPAAPEPAMTVDEELEEAIQQLDNTLSASEKKNYVHFDQIYGDVVDNKAFASFKYKQRPTSTPHSVNKDKSQQSTHPKDVQLENNKLWQKFIRLSDEERAFYYCEALRKEANSTMVQKLIEEKRSVTEFKALMPQYYDIAEKKLRERKKECPEDFDFVPTMFSYLKTEEAVNEPVAHFCDKYSNNTAKSEILSDSYCDHRKARMVYMRKQFPELLKEPGMADKRYFQLRLILGLRFHKLSDEERKPYYDLVKRMMEMSKYTEKFPVCRKAVMKKRFGDDQEWNQLSERTKANYTEEAKKNRQKLMEAFPDVDEHLRWVLIHKLKKADKYAKPSKTEAAFKSQNFSGNKPEDKCRIS